MTLRQYTIILGVGTAIIWTAWFLVLVSIDPFTAGALGYAIFFITFFGGIVGLLTLLATVTRSLHHPNRDLEDVVVISLRQSVILALLLIGSLILARQRSLNWLSITGILTIVGLLEAVFILKKRPVKHHNNT